MVIAALDEFIQHPRSHRAGAIKGQNSNQVLEFIRIDLFKQVTHPGGFQLKHPGGYRRA